MSSSVVLIFLLWRGVCFFFILFCYFFFMERGNHSVSVVWAVVLSWWAGLIAFFV